MANNVNKSWHLQTKIVPMAQQWNFSCVWRDTHKVFFFNVRIKERDLLRCCKEILLNMILVYVRNSIPSSCDRVDIVMMTSSNGSIFRVTGHLCGEFTGHRWIPRTKASDAELWCFLWSAPWINGWVNNREADDLRRRRAHYDVIVMGE